MRGTWVCHFGRSIFFSDEETGQWEREEGRTKTSTSSQNPMATTILLLLLVLHSFTLSSFLQLSFQQFSNTSTPSTINISWMILFNLLAVVTSSRYEKPVHYILKIQSFSLLKEGLACSPRQRFESQKFNAGGYEWCSYPFLCFYFEWPVTLPFWILILG